MRPNSRWDEMCGDEMVDVLNLLAPYAFKIGTIRPRLSMQAVDACKQIRHFCNVFNCKLLGSGWKLKPPEKQVSFFSIVEGDQYHGNCHVHLILFSDAPPPQHEFDRCWDEAKFKTRDNLKEFWLEDVDTRIEGMNVYLRKHSKYHYNSIGSEGYLDRMYASDSFWRLWNLVKPV